MIYYVISVSALAAAALLSKRDSELACDESVAKKLDDGSTYYMDTAYADFENSRDKYYFTTESDALYTGRVKEAALIATGK